MKVLIKEEIATCEFLGEINRPGKSLLLAVQGRMGKEDRGWSKSIELKCWVVKEEQLCKETM